MVTLRFTAPIKILGVNPYVLVRKDQAARLQPDWRRPIPVLVQINDKPDIPWHINMVPVGNGDFYLYLHETVRKASATKVGDRVIVTVEFDSEYRSGPAPLPGWLQSGLTTDPAVKQNWDNLSPSRQKEIVRYLLQLKSAAARKRNLEKVLVALSGKPIRFIGRGWLDGK